MTQPTLMEAQTSSGSLFPPAPEDSRAPAVATPKKRATARKSTTKKASSKKAAAKKISTEPQQQTLSIDAKPLVDQTKSATPTPEPSKIHLEETGADSNSAVATKNPERKLARKTSTTRGTRKKASSTKATSEISSAEPTPPTVPAPAPAPAPEIPPVRDPQPARAPETAPTEPQPATTPEPAPPTAPSIPPEAPASPPQQESATSPSADRDGKTDPTRQERDRGGDRNRERNDRGGRFRNKWEKRNKRFRDRRDRQGDPNADSGQQSAPPPERPLGPPEPSEGLLELTPKGYGHLRQKSRQYATNNQDPWVSPEWIRSLGLREGMYIKGIQQEGHRGPQVTQITEVNGMPPEKVRDLPLFEELKAINPSKRIQLETTQDRLTTRVMDLITPLGRGQRGLIVAPPRAGKTTLLQHIAEAITEKHPDMHLMILLVDERPEEVTEFRRTLPNAEIHASSNDSDVKSHMRTASFAIERAKRLVEAGHHVFMLLDSITRMGRAFNNAHKGGATMSGGVGVGALELPRRLFASARNTRDAGSLTILATTLIETNSRMDELIFQEFKGTGNLELVLDRKIAEQYIYPAVNIFKSGTRREELLLPPFQMEKIHLLRRGLAGHKPIDAIQRVITLLERSPNNAQMLVELPGGK